ncbi:MAG: PAS domain S-box protein, partial [Chitinophagaceae bacterium]
SDTTKAYYHMRLVPEFDDNASLKTVLCIARDITSLTESETRFQNLLREANVGLIVLEGEEMIVSIANDAFGKIIGHTVEAMLNKPLFDVIPQAAAFYKPIIDEVLHTGRNHRLDESPYEVVSETGELVKGYVSLVYQPYRSDGGNITGVMIVCNDITPLVLAKQKIADSEEKLRGVIAAAPAGIGLFIGRDLVIESPNKTFIDIIGKGPSIEGLPLHEAMPELTSEDQPFLKILDNVFTTGVPFVTPASLVKIVQNGVLNENYYNISYTPLRNSSGEIYGILDIAIDVTGQVVAQNALEASENRLKGIIEQSPVAMLVMRGDQFIIDQINAPMLELIGQNKSVIGKSLIDVLPEIRNQDAWDLTQKIYFEGIDFSGHEVMVTHSRGETISNHFYNLEYRPLREGDKITGVIQVVNDITEQVIARKAVEAKEAALSNATELAQLANWRVDLVTNQAHYSDRMADWVGLKEKTFDLYTSPIIHPDDMDSVAAGIKLALEPGSSGIFDETYSIVHIKTGQRRIIHAIGNVEYDEKKQPVAINGTAQDVTIQMELQVALESEVQKRTEELAAAIEELRATNEELEESNQLLLHSNDELAQYAYVASHDLQEPLRKIRVFTGMLDADGEGSSRNAGIIQKINTSATRMTLLIQDLLTFSRLLNSDTILREVPLAEIVNAVWDDFELIVDEKKAAIEVTSLPVIQAVSLQMNQLFYNLINNALKFTHQDRSPVITVKSSPMSTDEILKYIPKPYPFANYHHITIADNGIGFEMEYYEQIFEVFKRLHARENYPGSGIGLALCRRIVGNHNGFLFADSKVGEGSIFHVILPDRQREE